MPVPLSTIETLLTAKASHLRPTPTQFDGAQRSQNFLRDQLNSGQMEDRIVRSFLSGSYQRDTAIYPLDDVDIVFEVDLSHWQTGTFRSRPEPKAVLQTFARALRRRYSQAPVRLQRRSVGITLAHLHLDVVPAVAHEQDGFVLIPDRKANAWIVSAPEVHNRLATEVNKLCSGRFKPLVRLLKSWNQRQAAAARLRSFGVETIALRLFRAQPCDTLASGAARYFDFAAWLGRLASIWPWSDNLGIAFRGGPPELPDAANTGHNVLSNCTAERATAFSARALRAQAKFAAALRARDEESAQRHLDGLF